MERLWVLHVLVVVVCVRGVLVMGMHAIRSRL